MKKQKGLPVIPACSERQLQAGQTLLEILLAFGVLTLVLSAITIGIITSLSNAQYTKNQNLANSYAQQAMTVVKQIRDSSWNNFKNLEDFLDNNTAYCLTQDPIELKKLEFPAQNCAVQYPVGGIFSREVRFWHNSWDCSGGATNGSKVTIDVSWTDNKCPIGSPYCHKVELITCLSNLDQKSAP